MQSINTKSLRDNPCDLSLKVKPIVLFDQPFFSKKVAITHNGACPYHLLPGQVPPDSVGP